MAVGILSLLIALFFQRIEDIVVTFKALGIGIAPVIFYDWAGRRDKQSLVRALVAMTIVSLSVSLWMMDDAGEIDPAIAFVSIGTSTIVYGLSYSLRRTE